MRRLVALLAPLAADARLALMDGRGGSRGKCEPQYIPIAGGGGSGMSEAEIKLLVQNEVASLRDDLVGRMQTAASMATQPLEQALSETQAECRTLERLDEAIEMLKRAPGIEEVDQRLAFSDAKLAAALARLDAATLAASKTASPPPETASPPPEGAAPKASTRATGGLEQAVADLSRDRRHGDGRRADRGERRGAARGLSKLRCRATTTTTSGDAAARRARRRVGRGRRRRRGPRARGARAHGRRHECGRAHAEARERDARRRRAPREGARDAHHVHVPVPAAGGEHVLVYFVFSLGFFYAPPPLTSPPGAVSSRDGALLETFAVLSQSPL